MAEFTPQQINKIMEFATLTLQRQKFAPEKGDLRDTGMRSLSELENQIKDMNNVTGRLARGFRDLLKMPRSVEQAFNDIEKIIHNSTSKYADDINKLSKASLDAIRTHGANSDAIKNQTKGVLTSIHALKDFRENAITLNKLLEEKSKLDTRKTELVTKGTAATATEKKELVDIEKALISITEAYENQKTQITEELANVSKGIAMMPDGMRQAMIDAGFAQAIMDMQINLIGHDAKLSNDEIQMAGKQLNVLQELSQSMSVTFSQIKEYTKEIQSQGKAMALAAGAMAIAMGKSINDAVLSRQGANLAENNFVAAARMGISPSELNSVAKTSASELGMFSGTYNPGDALDDSGLMVQLQDTARKMGLVGVEGTKMALETFNFQRRSGTYDKDKTPEQRIQSSENFLRAMKSAAVELQMPLDEFSSEVKGLMDSGYLNPLLDKLDNSKLTGDEKDAAAIEQVKAIKANIKQLGYNNDYLKKTLDAQRAATSTGLEQYIRGQIGVSMGVSALDQYLDYDLTEKDRKIFDVVQRTGNDRSLGKEDQIRYQKILADAKTKSFAALEGLKVSGTPEEVAKAEAAYMRMITFNTMSQLIPTSSLDDQAQMTAYDAYRASKTNEDNTNADGSSPVLNKSKQALEDIIAPLNMFETTLLDIEQKIRGAFSSPIGAPFGAALGWAGNASAEIAGTVVGGFALNKMGLLGGAGKGLRMGGRVGALALGATALYGGYKYLTSDSGGGSGSTGGVPTIGPNGELSNATFSIQHAILNIGSNKMDVGTDTTSIPIVVSPILDNGNISDAALSAAGVASLGLTATSLARGTAGTISGKLLGPVMGIFDGMRTYNELGEDSSVGRAERIGGAVGSGLGSAGGWWAGAAAGASLGAAIGGTSLNPIVAGALGLAGGAIGAYAGEAAVQEAGATAGAAIDYMTDSTAELFWQMDKFAENFGIGVQEVPDTRAIQWIDENSNASGLPSKVIEAQEQKAKLEAKTEEQKEEIATEDVKAFMDKVSNVLDIIGNYVPWIKAKDTQTEMANKSEADIDKQMAASAKERLDSGIAGFYDKVNRNLDRVNKNAY